MYRTRSQVRTSNAASWHTKIGRFISPKNRFFRGHPNRWFILLINIVLGGTIFGWGSQYSGPYEHSTSTAARAAAGNPASTFSSMTSKESKS
jgi:hypothetical protein